MSEEEEKLGLEEEVERGRDMRGTRDRSIGLDNVYAKWGEHSPSFTRMQGQLRSDSTASIKRSWLSDSRYMERTCCSTLTRRLVSS